MQKTDTTAMEMIRRRERAGFCYLNRSFLAEKVHKVPSIDQMEELEDGKWWHGSSVMSNFVNTHDGKETDVETRLRIVYDDEAIFAAFKMHEPRMDKTCACVTKQGTREIKLVDPVSGKEMLPYAINKDDHVQLLLDPTHRHGRYIRLFMNIAGVGYADQVESDCPSESVYLRSHLLEKWERQYRCCASKADDYWYAAFCLPWESLDIDSTRVSVVGINAVRCRTVGEMQHHVLCFGPNAGNQAAAADFGDLYLGEARIALEEIDFGLPVLADNAFTARIRNTTDRAAKIDCKAVLTVDSTQKIFSADTCNLNLSPGETGKVKLQYTLDWQEYGGQTLLLSIREVGKEEVLLETPYRFGYNRNITAEQPHVFVESQPDPAPSDKNFIAKKRAYILSRLPRFARVTTAEGAKSDFTLRSVCGAYEFNLMKSGVLREIAKMVEGIFDGRDDRLIAATLLAHQKAFSMHISPHVALHRQITPLSALRLNAGHCYSRTLVWVGIVRQLSTDDGREKYGRRVHGLLVLGHVIGALDVGEDRILFDPSSGSFYYNWDNTRFATEVEMSEDPFLADRMMRDSTRFFAFPQYHRAIPAGQIVFPQGAVAE